MSAESAVQDAPEQRRTLLVLASAQVLSGFGLAAGITVGALLAQDMLGSTSLAGLPALLFTAGSALAAAAMGRVSQRRGRRDGLAAGLAAGAVGGAGVVAAAVVGSPALLFASLFVYGAGSASNLQARYAGADLAAEHRRGRAVAVVLVATTVGAVAGPALAGVVGDVAEGLSIPRLAGPFALASVAYGLGAVVLWVALRPDPLLLARARAAEQAAAPSPAGLGDAHAEDAATRSAAPTAGRSTGAAGVRLGAAIMIVTQIVMIAVMTMTPIHMRGHGHDVSAIGIVIGVHVAAMFLPAPLSGWLVDRFGPLPVGVAAAATLAAAGVVSAVAPVDSLPLLIVALALLGLGWSLGLVAGTALVTASAPVERRASVQGSVDFLIAIAGATGGGASGIVMAHSSYGALALGGGVLALVLVPFMIGGPRSARLAQ
ncbi:MFS transporter [Demequina sp.]|uniref:MFS transporter n=1 Tax=Demequina sp. TaxID=2050685 RepID=UPI0025EC7C2E|nr:MFS transporter [Demequina sp.]